MGSQLIVTQVTGGLWVRNPPLLIDAQTAEKLRQSLGVDDEPPAINHHVLDLIEGLEEPHLYRAVSFGFGESAIVTRGPLRRSFFCQKDADCKSGLSVRGYIKNKLGRGTLGQASHRRALPHKIILVDVSLPTGVGLHAANGHKQLLVIRSFVAGYGKWIRLEPVAKGRRPRANGRCYGSIFASRSRLTAVSEDSGE
jgi:hypothetical protein